MMLPFILHNFQLTQVQFLEYVFNVTYKIKSGLLSGKPNTSLQGQINAYAGFLSNRSEEATVVPLI